MKRVTGNEMRLYAITNSEQPSDVAVKIMDKKCKHGCNDLARTKRFSLL